MSTAEAPPEPMVFRLEDLGNQPPLSEIQEEVLASRKSAMLLF